MTRISNGPINADGGGIIDVSLSFFGLTWKLLVGENNDPVVPVPKAKVQLTTQFFACLQLIVVAFLGLIKDNLG